MSESSISVLCVGVISSSNEDETEGSSQAAHGKVSRRRRSRLWRHCQVKFLILVDIVACISIFIFLISHFSKVVFCTLMFSKKKG